IKALPFPVVSAVNGVAAGAGANLALSADLVVAAQSARFIQSFTNIGLIPDAGGTWLLPRLVGRARANGLALLAEPLSAGEAERMGLIWKCVPDEALMPTVADIAARIATRSKTAMRLAKKALAES